MTISHAICLMCAVMAMCYSTGLIWPAASLVLAYILGFLASDSRRPPSPQAS